MDSITEAEVAAIVKTLRKNRAAGPDEFPAEVWQAIAESSEGLSWLTVFCNRCWNEEEIPDEWCSSLVSCIHKKGNVEIPDNYRPISLVCVAYKIFASLLLHRLVAGGAEDRLTTTQFGFRKGRGTNDALFAVRRHLDLALAQRHGHTAMLALDWKKAFDAINVDALIVGLRRFGVPQKMLNILEHIYAERHFSVSGGDSQSTRRRQRSGISQGCPLSPFLFIMLMTVVRKDSMEKLSAGPKEQCKQGALSVLLYADDTLIIGASQNGVQELLNVIAEVGLRFGMELHWDNFQFLEAIAL